MARSKTHFKDVAQQIHQAGAGVLAWPVAMKAAADFVGGAGAVCFGLNRKTGQFSQFHTHGVEPGVGEYVEHMNRINPRMRYSLRQAGPHVVCDWDVLPDAAIQRHEFYNWMERTNGTRYFVGSRVQDSGDHSLFASIEFTPTQGHPQKSQIAAFTTLLPILKEAWSLLELRTIAGAVTAMSTVLHEACPWGVIVLNCHGDIISMNSRAKKILATGESIRDVEGRLHALRGADDRALQAIIADKLALHSSGVGGERSLLSIARLGAKLPLVLRIAALPQDKSIVLPSAPALLVFLSDIGEGPLLTEAELEQLFGLSRREAALAMHLAEGVTLPEAIRRMGISHNTGRAHLREIFSKTGAHSQLQLVWLLNKVPTL
ncbi:MAG: helix-turn-helix transcriptional regulator [Alphaproteobacteria bacterium]|nr:helix-turn-helix transcriptional regulator [Alphaproteobacteria bacterium]